MKTQQNISLPVQQLFSGGRLITFPKNETIIRAGDTPLGVYLIISGWVRACTVCPDGEPNINNTLYKGDLFPLSWAVTGTIQSSSFIANDQTTVLRISHDDFLHQIETDSAITRSVMELLAQRTRSFIDAHDNLHFRSARQRIAYRLLALARIFGQQTATGVRINTPVTNEYIARSTNMTRETASREINKFIRHNIISTDKAQYTLLDSAALEAISSGKRAT